MKKLTPYCIFIGSFIIGFFFAIQIQTGINISPDNLIINVADKFYQLIIQQINLPQFLSMWKNIKLLITIIGITFLVIDIFLIISYGWIGIIIAFLGFLSGLLIILSAQIGIIILFIGAIVTRFIIIIQP